MNKTNIQLRKIYLRMKGNGKTVLQIAQDTGLNIKTLYSWKNISDDDLLREPDKNTRKPTFDIETLNKYIRDNSFAFNKEIGKVFGKHPNTIQYWRSKLGFKRKKAKTTYKESDPELKKTSTKI